MQLRIVHTDGKQSDLMVGAPLVRLGRIGCEVMFDGTQYPGVSSQHASIAVTPTGAVLSHLSRRNKTLLNGKEVESQASIKAGDTVRLGFSGPSIIVLSLNAAAQAPVAPAAAAVPVAPAAPAVAAPAVRTTAAAAAVPAVDVPTDGLGTMQAEIQHVALLRGTATAADWFEFGSGGMIGREKGQVQFLLDHPHVSRMHARLGVVKGRAVIADNRSANGTYVNGRRITATVALSPGDRIDIGPFALEFDGKMLVSRSRSNHIELTARGLQRVVRDRATGRPLNLLNDVNLIIRPGEFVCLLGPSGSGKTTLMAMLSGRNPPSDGVVAINGQDLYANFQSLKQEMAMVPQKDVLHDSLSVQSAMRYTAELRLPPDTSGDEIKTSVSDILQIVGLTKQQGTFIRHLSGGQVKRASLANELMARPSLLFLDEVTSGLDEQTDQEMMELFRQVADGGKTVVCITHSLANVEANCHLVVILTAGGYLAFVGTPEEAKSYFQVPRLGDVYAKLATQPAEVWKRQFESTLFHKQYVRDRLPQESLDSRGGTLGQQSPPRPNPVSQALILTRRSLSIWRGDIMALATMFGQSILVAVLLAMVFGNLSKIGNPVERMQRTVNVIFLSAVSCFWFGCNNAAKELVKERIIYLRERAFNLRISSYVASKFLILSLIGCLQATILFATVKMRCEPPGNTVLQWFSFVALATTGTVLGLCISALSTSEGVAIALVPIAVIPQIILGGVIAPLTDLPKILAQLFMTVYWGVQSLENLLSDKDLAILGLDPYNFFIAVAIVGMHALVCGAITIIALSRSGRRTY